MGSPRAWDATFSPRGTPKHLQGETKNLTGGKYGFFEATKANGGDQDQPDGQAARECAVSLRVFSAGAR